MAKKVKESKAELVDVLADEINKSQKGQKAAFFLDDDSAPTNVEGWVSTGDAMLDVAISNQAYGGMPFGRIVEITGLEQSGKSLLAAHLLAETQKLGGIAVMIDTETAVSRDFLEAIGVDISKLLYIQADTVEQIFEFTETIITKVRETTRDKPVTIVTDSVAAASTKVEMEGDYDQSGYATQKAIIISKAMRKITNTIGRQRVLVVYTNQLRAKMNAMFGDPWTTSGGKGLAFHASVRLRLKNMGQLKVGDRIIGIKVRVQVIKNRMGPPLRSTDIEIYFDRGIDRHSSWLGIMKDTKLLKQGGAWYTYVDIETGEEHKFQSKDFSKLLDSNPEIQKQIYERICEATILAYRTNNIDFDEVEVDTKGAGVGD